VQFPPGAKLAEAPLRDVAAQDLEALEHGQEQAAPSLLREAHDLVRERGEARSAAPERADDHVVNEGGRLRGDPLVLEHIELAHRQLGVEGDDALHLVEHADDALRVQRQVARVLLQVAADRHLDVLDHHLPKGDLAHRHGQRQRPLAHLHTRRGQRVALGERLAAGKERVHEGLSGPRVRELVRQAAGLAPRLCDDLRERLGRAADLRRERRAGVGLGQHLVQDTERVVERDQHAL